MTLTAQSATGQGRQPAKRAAKLSPELSEFLHMLDALEGQFDGEARRVQ